MSTRGSEFHVAGAYQPLMRMIGIDAETVFTHPDIVAWRTLPDRENCTLDARLPDGRPVRWHVKRYAAARTPTPADDEVRGHRLLEARHIPTASLVGWGHVADGRSFVIFDELAGYTPADKLIEAGTEFQQLLEPTADLAARLHEAGLHHRDLYVCHFMAKRDDPSVDVRLIDSARVRELPNFLTRTRWIVKDLAEFWYSTLRLAVTDAQREAWLVRYSSQRKLGNIASLQRAIERKSRSIARHDIRLHRSRPERDVSIPPGLLR